MNAILDHRLLILGDDAGVTYLDRHSEDKHGEFRVIARLPFTTRKLEILPDCPAGLRADIELHAETMPCTLP